MAYQVLRPIRTHCKLATTVWSTELTEQERTPSIPSQHVPNEGGKGNHTKDIYPSRLQHTIREAIRTILY